MARSRSRDRHRRRSGERDRVDRDVHRERRASPERRRRASPGRDRNRGGDHRGTERYDRREERDRDRRRRRTRSRSPIVDEDRERDRVDAFGGGDLLPKKKHEKKKKQMPITIEELTVEDQEMAKTMGFANFDTTQNKQVDGNIGGATAVNKRRRYRQYMNRRGGFNRPLDYVV